jgi:ABC-type transport system substrate-binding protein
LIPEAAVEDLTRLRAKAGDEWNLVFYPSLKIAGFLYNCRTGALAKKEFRRALTHASNRSRWLDDYFQQQGFSSPVPPRPTVGSTIRKCRLCPGTWPKQSR